MFGWRPRAPDPIAPPTGGGTPSITDQPARLGELAQQGLLTSEEFAAAKARLLGS
ncbi:SHOCT domain-containing protein [Streptomyces sp. NPDC020472]|uniref:SHOCT domain-containing protein n=1 Tax=Streptomyces sp. NPDC020472 TaxID=3365075 RepID=UPI00379EF29A